MKLHFPLRELAVAWLMATLFSGAPSTVHALLTGGDPLQATFAAGEMLVPAESDGIVLFGAAAVVHLAVSAFWTGVLGFFLPERHVTLFAIGAAAAIAVLDLLWIAPAAFPSVAALPFWPQFADHLAWGALLGGTLSLKSFRPRSRTSSASRWPSRR